MTSDNDPAPDSQPRNELHGNTQSVVQVHSLVGNVAFNSGRTWPKRGILLAALFALLIAGAVAVVQFKFPFGIDSVVAAPATTSPPKTDSSVTPPPSTTRPEPAPSKPKPKPPPPPDTTPVTTTTSSSPLPTQPRAESGPRNCLVNADSQHAIYGGDWGQICTISPGAGEYYDYIVACDGEADGLTAFSKYLLVDGLGFEEYRTVADTNGVSNGCVPADWRGTKYWARAVSICETTSNCSAWVYTPLPSSGGKPTS